MDTTVRARPQAGPREWLGLAVLALPTLLITMDATVLYLAVPHLGADLGPSDNQLLWIVDSYGFLIAGFLITMGTLGDRVGRRRLLMIGGTAFAATSVLAAYAPTPEVLIAARALLGIAGATLMPSTLALISNMFRDTRQRATAIGLWATCISGGVALGPIVGGLLLEWFWWGSVFLLAVPVMAILVATAPLLLPEFRDRKAGRLDPVSELASEPSNAGRPRAASTSLRVDVPSVVLSLVTVLPVIYGIKQLAKGGGVVPVVAIIAGVGFGTLFAARQRRLADPLLDLRMFRDRSFSSALVVLVLGLGVVGGVYLFVTQYLQLVGGFSPLQAGLWLMPCAAVLVVASMATPAIARRVRPTRLLGVALAVSTVGFVVLAMVGPGGGLPLLVIGFSLVYVGTSPVMVLGTDLVVGTAPPAKAGAAAAMSETAMEFGLALGAAVLGVIGTAVATDGGALLDSTPAAFTAGLNTVAVVCAVVVAVLSVLSLRVKTSE